MLDHLGVPSRRAQVGGSSGGMVALAFAEFHPKRVASVRTISAADRAHPMTLAARFPAVPQLEEGRFLFPVERHRFGADAALLGRFRAEAFLCLSESLDLHQLDASRIGVPTLAVAAHEDQLVPLTDVRVLVARMPSAQLRDILAAMLPA